MHSTKIKLDLKKYKRFFAFGCSFTFYNWPTWADIISKEIPKSYNYGRPGAGNFYIFSSIIEANKKHKFTEDDLIIVMWTAVDREDRYIEHNWKSSGCVYHSIDNFYDKNFIMKYVDQRGFYLRDITYVAAITKMLEGLNYYFLSMMKFESSGESNTVGEADTDISDFYKDELKKILPSVLNTICNGNWIEQSKMKGKDKNGKLFRDLHPTPNYYLEYLNNIFDIEFSKETIMFVDEHEGALNKLEFLDHNIYPYYARPYIERL